jgi:hypothetical protein
VSGDSLQIVYAIKAAHCISYPADYGFPGPKPRPDETLCDADVQLRNNRVMQSDERNGLDPDWAVA